MAKTKLIKEDDIDTKAGQTLHPNSDNASHAGDPKSRFEYLASMIGAVNAMRDNHLEKWWKDSVGLIGKEARNIPDGTRDRNSSSIDAKSSDAAVSKVSKVSYSQAMPSLKEAMMDDLKKIFAVQEGLSDEVQAKMATLFETALVAMLQLKEEEMRSQIEEEMEEAFGEVVVDLSESVEEYLEEIAAKWFEDNEVAVESSIRNELAEDFLKGLKNLFVEHFVDVPENRVDIVNSLAEKVEELETQLADAIEENIELRKHVEHTTKEDIVEAACEGLTTVDAQRLIELAEAIDTDDLEDFGEKVSIIRESQFVQGKKNVKIRPAVTINEQMEEVNEDNIPPEERTYSSPEMANYASAISRTIRR